MILKHIFRVAQIHKWCHHWEELEKPFKKMVWLPMLRCMVPEMLRFENWKNLLTAFFCIFPGYEAEGGQNAKKVNGSLKR